jgi:ribosomal protein S18 acetylase RimI-like enzyme
MAQPSEQICYMPMTLACHNLRDVACLIYESAPDLFSIMFGAQAITCLTELIQRSHNRFSHQYIHIAVINQKVVGIAILIPGDRLKDNADYAQVLKFHQQLWLQLLQWLILRHVLHHDYPAETFYIGNLAVAAEYRNRGIGRQLLRQCIASATGVPSKIFISVDIRNLRAQKLYESLGFRVVATRTIRLFRTIGSRILSLSIPEQPCPISPQQPSMDP